MPSGTNGDGRPKHSFDNPYCSTLCDDSVDTSQIVEYISPIYRIDSMHIAVCLLGHRPYGRDSASLLQPNVACLGNDDEL